ncbi:MAG: STAS domain-containing protein [Rhodococcus sp. (in: high G+C Gram-positive bacteria)]
MTMSTLHTSATTITVVDDDVVMDGGLVSVDRTDTALTYRVTGSIDLSNSSTFESVVTADAGGRAIVLDLSDVEFFGTAALSVVAGLDSDCSASGTQLTIAVGDAVHRVMTAAHWNPAARVTR